MEILVASLCFLTVGNIGLVAYAAITAKKARELAEALAER